MNKRVSLSAKLYAIAGVLLVFTVIVAGTGYFSMSYIVKEYEKSLNENAAQLQAATEAQNYLGLAVQAFKDYLLRKDEKYIKQFPEYEGNIEKQIEIFAKFSTDADEKAALDTVRQAIVPYRESFDVMAKARQASDDIAAVDKSIKGVDQPLRKALISLGNIVKNKFENTQQNIKSIVFKLKAAVVIATVIAIVLGIALSNLLIRKILKSIMAVKDVAEKASNGNLTNVVPIYSDDEIGDMASAFNSMLASIKGMFGRLNAAVNTMASSSEELSATVAEITKMVSDQSNRASQIATSSTEMTQTVIDIAKNATDMASSSNDTLNIANEGAGVVSRTISEVRKISQTVSSLAEAMKALGDRSKQIGEIVNVIKDIADQTNLLALNAAIEAARAGEQGRGFAVVADEVRKLAERTGKSTTEISEMIVAIQNETAKAVQSMEEGTRTVESGVDLATQAGDALGKIVGSVSALQSTVQQIASATEEMTATAESISSDIEAVASAAKETSASAEEITHAANDLSILSSDLKADVDKFKI